jgi:hypothetical protein
MRKKVKIKYRLKFVEFFVSPGATYGLGLAGHPTGLGQRVVLVVIVTQVTRRALQTRCVLTAVWITIA